MLLGMLTLGALLGGALAALAPAGAEAPPADLALTLSVNDADGVIQPGQEFSLSAKLTYSGSRDPLKWDQLQISGGTLRLPVGLEWGTGGRVGAISATPVNDERGLVSFEQIAIRDEDGSLPPNRSRATIRAMDGRTAVVHRDSDGGGRARLYIYDIYNKRQSITINAPAGANDGRQGFGTSLGSEQSARLGARTYEGTAIAVWHESESLAWLFVGSNTDSRYGHSGIGSVYVYRLDWSTTTPTAELKATLFPDEEDACNRWGASCAARYGSAVTISPDGRALAVGAPHINQTGAVYVYMRPDGAGESWGDVRHEDAIKVTTAAVPAWGNGQTDAPFTPSSTGRTGASTDCDAYCSRVRAQQDSRVGKYLAKFSGNAEVLVVGAPYKQFPANTPGGSFTSGTNAAGEAYVFVAPRGDWETYATDATVDEQKNAKTLIGAKEDARGFDPAMHYSPGPRLRVTEPTATLVYTDWASPLNNTWFGQAGDITLDGSTIAVSNGWDYDAPNLGLQGRGTIRIYQLDAGETWAKQGKDNPNGLEADASFTSGGYLWPLGQFAFSADGNTLLLGDPLTGGNDVGLVRSHRRPVGGWSGSRAIWIGDPPQHQFWYETEPPAQGRALAGWGYIVFSLDRQLLAISAIGHKSFGFGQWVEDGNSSGGGRSYLSEREEGGCSSRPDESGSLVTTCSVTLPGTNVFVPLGTTEGTYPIRGELKVRLGDDEANEATLKGELELEIGVVKIAEAKLDFALHTRGTADPSDDQEFPSTIRSGESTQLRLQILTDRGDPAGPDTISSVVANTTIGTLRSNIGTLPGCVAAESTACRLDSSALTEDNSGNILLTLRHRGTAGKANVDVMVITKAGEVVRSEVRTVTLTGPATALNIAAPTGGVLNVGTPDAGGDTDEADVDDRDLLRLSVTAADANGAKVTVPAGRYAATLTGPDGRRVTSGVAVEWPLGGAATPTRSAAGDLQAQVDVDRSVGQALANGEYTLSLRADTLRAEQKFMVSGAAATVTLSEPSETPAVQGQFTITATIVDAAGESVPNGTAVAWSNLTIGDGSTTLVQTGATTRTVDGKATSTWLAVAHGRASVRATADTISNVVLVTVPDPSPPAPPPTSLADMLSSTTPGAPTSWLGESSVRASDLVAALEGVDTILLWQYDRWIRYGVEAGRVIPGSYDFVAESGAVLWLGGG